MDPLSGTTVVLTLGATLVFLMFPKKQREEELLAEYQEHDAASSVKEPEL
jgi:hypothetical protein